LKRFAKVRVELDSRPESVALVRAVLSGIAEWRELDPELLNDLKTAVSEACNNVVVHAYDDGVRGPMSVNVDADGAGLTATVRDCGVGLQAVATREDRPGVGLAVISALAARAEFATPADGGTEVRMWFPATARATPPLVHFNPPRFAAGPPHRPVRAEHGPAGQASPARELAGDARVTLSPLSLTTAVLGRLARALAASARFSFDRFSDIYLVADAIGAHAQRSAADDRIAFSATGSAKRLELVVGPFEAGSGARLLRRHTDAQGEPESPLSLLADELRVDGDERSETLHIVLRDRGGPMRGGAGGDY
jgi:anti-sigma regulatory factor (Ser/Thr protein kinase)